GVVKQRKATSWDRIEAADREHAPDIGKGQPLGFEVRLIRGEQGHEMSTGGMPTDEELIGSTSVLGDILVYPSEGPGRILDVGWEAHLGIEPIVDADHPNAILG